MTPAVLPMPEGLSGFVILHSIDGIQSPIGDLHSDGVKTQSSLKTLLSTLSAKCQVPNPLFFIETNALVVHSGESTELFFI